MFFGLDTHIIKKKKEDLKRVVFEAENNISIESTG